MTITFWEVSIYVGPVLQFVLSFAGFVGFLLLVGFLMANGHEVWYVRERGRRRPKTIEEIVVRRLEDE